MFSCFWVVLTLLDLQAKRRAAKMNAADAAITMAKSAASIPVIGFGIAAAVGAAALVGFMSMLSKGDDVISQGYGKRMLLDKGSITAFNDNDTIVAGTNLDGGKRNTGGGGGGDNSALIAAIDSLHSTMKTKSNDIYMDSQKVGTQVGRQTSTGTQQSMNSYRLA